MSKAKKATGRKGKKQWRKNIPTDSHDALVETADKEARLGGSVEALPDEAIFVIDKEKDAKLERKVDRARKKRLLHCEAILQRSSLVPPVTWSSRRKAESKKLKATAAPSSVEESKGSKRKAAYDMWGNADKSGKKKVQKRALTAPAVEVDHPGCSFNPRYEEHQEVLGKAVAEEVQKTLKRELEPAVPKALLDGGPLADDAEERYFLDVDEGPETAAADEDKDGADEGSAAYAAQKAQQKKLTQADLNRRLRRRAQLAEEAVRKQEKKQRQDLEKLPDLMVSLEEQEKEKEMRRLRKQTSKAEREKEAPPRLGRRKFQPEPVQVLLTEEVTGSLRQLKAYPSLVKDRFKSLQRRGILEPRVPARKRKGYSKGRVSYEQGTKGDKEREMHAQLLAERAARQKGDQLQIYD